MTVRARIIEIVSLATAINYPSEKISSSEAPKITWGYNPNTNEFSLFFPENENYTRYFVDCTKHKAYEELGEIIEKLKNIKEG